MIILKNQQAEYIIDYIFKKEKLMVENVRVSKKGEIVGFTYKGTFVEVNEDVEKVIEICKRAGVPFRNQSLKALCEEIIARNYCLPITL